MIYLHIIAVLIAVVLVRAVIRWYWPKKICRTCENYGYTRGCGQCMNCRNFSHWSR